MHLKSQESKKKSLNKRIKKLSNSLMKRLNLDLMMRKRMIKEKQLTKMISKRTKMDLILILMGSLIREMKSLFLMQNRMHFKSTNRISSTMIKLKLLKSCRLPFLEETRRDKEIRQKVWKMMILTIGRDESEKGQKNGRQLFLIVKSRTKWRNTCFEVENKLERCLNSSNQPMKKVFLMKNALIKSIIPNTTLS